MRQIDRDEDWQAVRHCWSLKPGVVYFNHGSFGPPPHAVISQREQWGRELDAQPMEGFVERFEPMWIESRDAVADFVNASADSLALVENATTAMNVVAHSFPLAAGDEVLLTDHEYGAVQRIWQRACNHCGASLREVRLGGKHGRLEDPDDVIGRVRAALTTRTQLLVISHITSKTALILPIKEIINIAHEADVAVCVDGPHAVAQLPLDLADLGADFYCASCHKWLSAAFGTGFLHVQPRWAEHIQTPTLGWGRILPAQPECWVDEMMWCGTRDNAALATLPTAIQFLRDIGPIAFRQRTHWLAQYAQDQLQSQLNLPSLAQPFDTWYGAMAHVCLPPGPALPLQVYLREQFQIEAPIVEFEDQRWIRISCHLYNTTQEVRFLTESLLAALPRFS